MVREAPKAVRSTRGRQRPDYRTQASFGGNYLQNSLLPPLFQEWLSYPEAETEQRSFENVFLIPMPKDTVDVTVELRNNRREVMTALTHTVSPQDILIHHIGKTPTDYEIIQQAKDTSNCIHIAYVAEGYQVR